MSGLLLTPQQRPIKGKNLVEWALPDTLRSGVLTLLLEMLRALSLLQFFFFNWWGEVTITAGLTRLSVGCLGVG